MREKNAERYRERSNRGKKIKGTDMYNGGTKSWRGGGVDRNE
jgi:hypothetical protein